MSNSTHVSTPYAASVAGTTLRQAQHWAKTGLVVPTHETSGRGDFRRYDARDVMTLAIVAELRRAGVSCQRCRLVQSRLREYGKSFTSARLAVVSGVERDARSDVFVVENERALLSLLDEPGQRILRAVIPLRAIERRTQKKLAKAAKLIALRNEKRRSVA